MSSFSSGGDEPSAAEWAIMAISVAVTLSLFGVVVWHSAMAPAQATPEVSITDTRTLEDGRTVLTVEVYNPGDTGLDSVTVSADCSNESVTFEHIPAAARRTGSVVCPAGTADPSVSLQNWVRVLGSQSN